MKNIKVLLVLPILLFVQSISAQTNAHLKLSTAQPAAGQKITLTYNPNGTAVAGKDDISAVVYYFDNKDYPAADITLKPAGKLLKGSFTIPSTAKAFFIRVSSGEEVDNNNDKGYVYMIYKNQKPVAGAYASKGYMTISGAGNYYGKIKSEPADVVALYKKEFATYSASEKDYQASYYNYIANIPAYKDLVGPKIARLEKSNDEKDLVLAISLLRATKDTVAANSLNTIVKAKFPNGDAVKNDLVKSFLKEKDAAKKAAIYDAYISKYPDLPGDKYPVQDSYRIQVVWAYLKNADMANYHKYESLVTQKQNLAAYLNNVAYGWSKKGEHLDDAEKIQKQALDYLSAAIAKPTGSKYYSALQAKADNQSSYYGYEDTYAFILYKENKFGEALKYEQEVMANSKEKESDLYEHYILMLSAAGKYDKAKEIAEESMYAGQSSEAITQQLKKDYTKLKGSDAGFDQYLANVITVAKDKVKAALAKTMINKPAPAFALKDLDGKIVSLADLKGKVVIVDFWATWCGPCKASFPGMQLAVTKYKDDPNVKFLFVDTWETGDNYVDGVKKFIADNKYTFHVLVDEKAADGKQAKVVTAFDVSGIPTKFIIDKNGSIRFKYVGYSGAPEKLVEEVTNMIDMTNNADIATVNTPAKGEGKSKE